MRGGLGWDRRWAVTCDGDLPPMATRQRSCNDCSQRGLMPFFAAAEGTKMNGSPNRRLEGLRVDKARFLVLAAALAAGGCTVTNIDKGGPDGASPGGAAGTGGTAGLGGAAGTGGMAGLGGAAGTGGMATDGAAAIDSAAGGGDAAADGATAVQDAGVDAVDSGVILDGRGGDSAPGPDANDSGTGDSAPAQDSSDGGCRGQTGNPGTCALSPEAGTDCAWALSYCSSMSGYLKPGVAEAAVACVAGLPDCVDTYTCVSGALAKACPDSTADALCVELETACGDSIAICHSLVDGLNAAGRQAILECATGAAGDQCAYGLWSCVEGL
jgi:hypothetical protein